MTAEIVKIKFLSISKLCKFIHKVVRREDYRGRKFLVIIEERQQQKNS